MGGGGGMVHLEALALKAEGSFSNIMLSGLMLQLTWKVLNLCFYSTRIS